MSTSAVLAQEADEPNPEGIVTGRLSSSKYNDVALVQPVEFHKPDEQTVTEVIDGWFNTGTTPLTVLDVHVTVGGRPTGSGLIVDVTKNGITVFNDDDDRPTVAPGTFTSGRVPVTKTGDPVIVRPGDFITVGVAAVGSGDPGSHLTVKVRLG